MAILSALTKLFGGSHAATPFIAPAQGKPRLDLADVPKYPPYNPGLPAVTPDQIVESQRELIDRLRNAVSLPDAQFDRTYLAAIKGYASFVHLLPASESHHHRGTGGLFRHGLEAGLYGAMHADRMLFILDEAPARRRELEPIWRFAAFLAALNHDIGKPVSDVAVVDRSGALAWNPFADSLHQWAEKNGIDYYHIRFRPGRHQDHETVGMLALEMVVAADLKQYLAEAGPKLLRWMISAIANAQGAESVNPFRDLVIRADRDSVERDLRVNGAMQSNMPSVGTAAERFVIDAMRRLVRNKTWEVNKKGARIWIIDGNLYVAWNAARDIVRVIAEDKTPGVPRDPDSIADMLIERGLAVARESFHGPRRYWMIVPEILGGAVTLKTLRLSTPDLLLDPPPGSVVGRVLPGEEEEPSGSAPDSPATSSTATSTAPSAAGSDANATGAPAGVPVPASPQAAAPVQSIPQKAGAIGPQSGRSTEKPAPSQEEKSGQEIGQSLSGAGESRAEPHPPKSPKSAVASQEPRPASVPAPAENPFEGRGLVSEIIASLVEDIQSGRKPSDSLRQESGLYVLAWPDALQGFGMEPRAALKTLEDACLVEPDPSMPTRLVRDTSDGKKIVVLKHREGQALLAMVAQMPAGSRPVAGKSAAKPTAKPAPEKQASGNGRPSPAKGDACATDGEDLVERFMRLFLDPPTAPPFPIVQIQGGVSVPLNLAAGFFAREQGTSPKAVKAALTADLESNKPRIALANVRGSERIEIHRHAA